VELFDCPTSGLIWNIILTGPLSGWRKLGENDRRRTLEPDDLGRATEAQRQFLADMEQAGAFTCLAESLDRALKALENWGLLRGVAA